MKIRRFSLGASALVIAFAVSGCTHRLLPNQGDSTARVYQSEDIYKAIQEDIQQLGDPKVDPNVKKYLGMIIGLAHGESRDIDGGTQVKIISSDADGYLVEVQEGKYLGYRGFVAKANLR
jgi:hypothetical protein